MAFCTNCGANISAGVKFCPNCESGSSQPSGISQSPSPATAGRGSMSKTIYGFAAVGAVVALVPLASYLLIPMEVYLLYKITTRYRDLDVPSFAGVALALVTGSAFLKSVAALLNVVVGLGQIANS